MKTKSDLWKEFLADCQRQGFQVVATDSRVFRHYAEFYKWNQWTVALQCDSDFDPSLVSVERYFDHESQDHRAKLEAFPWDDRKKALELALRWRKALSGDLASEAYATAEA
jgi:hypothetical protein